MENETIEPRHQKPQARQGWTEASKDLADSGEDVMVMGEFPNADDAELTW
ncbi:hypothetical protein [Burkholderia sp. 8Y]|nr:hypothetical protein [Burkholderia sp. 8Y]